LEYLDGGDNLSVRAFAAVAAAISVGAAAFALPSAESARAACPYQAQVITYNPRGWQPLLDSLAASQTPCAQYYVVLPPVSDKVTPRGRRLVEAVRRKGANFHPVAEFSWKGWYGKPGSWYSKGVAFRRKMAAAGYDPRRGETWAINELPSTIRSRADTRQRARDLIRGLHTGPAGSTPSAGAVFIVGVGQAMRNFGPYKATLQGWLQDAAFWTAITPHVTWWGQEVYPSCTRVCVPQQRGGRPIRIADRSTAINDFTQHMAKLAYVGPPTTAAARAFFDKAWTPVMTAFWRDTKGYGVNTIPLDTMMQFVSLEVYAARAWAGPRPYPDGRIGMAWNQTPRGAQPGETQQLAGRLAQAIQGAYGDGGTAAKACSPNGAYTWCAPQFPGAAFNAGWKTFDSW
jgi:hypothetical protein